MPRDELHEEMTDAWRIINALHAQRMDEGEPWHRALQWLHRNEQFRPAPHPVSSDPP